MKSKIETTAPQQAEIDWGKPMLVKYNDMVVLTSSKHSGNDFSGTIIISDVYPAGYYLTTWDKRVFQPLPLPQTITFYE